MNFAIVGCGGIGHKRLKTLRPPDQLVIAADSVPGRAAEFARTRPGALDTTDWQHAVSHPEVETVIVSTTNDSLAPITIAAVQEGKHVLVEKPAARSLDEIQQVTASVDDRTCCVWVGFNHRYHPALQKAKAMVDAGTLGPLMFIRGRYGHGGRIGYDREWRANPQISGGGELLDQGVHLIDLARWFLGDFTSIGGLAKTYFWDMRVEDNAFLLLRNRQDQAAWLHASCTEWKNLFSFEIYGREGKLQIDGLGGSYGLERLTYHRVLPEMGQPDTTVWDFPGEDVSWTDELNAFKERVQSGNSLTQSLRDAEAALVVVDTLYKHTAELGLSHKILLEESSTPISLTSGGQA